MPRTCLPPGAVELRGGDRQHGSPFLGGVDSVGRLGFFNPKNNRCLWLPLFQIISAAARAAGCSYGEMVEFLRKQDPNIMAGQCAPDLKEHAHAGDLRSGRDQA